MLKRLQRKTLIPAQIAGYAITLLVGVTIVLLAFQLYSDIRPLLTRQSDDVFGNHAVTLSKNVSINKDNNRFEEEEIKDIKSRPFVKEVAFFRPSTFEAKASIRIGPGVSTDIFFESVPDKYIDSNIVKNDEWRWDTTQSNNQIIPIVIPEDYLNLYNFGFAESQALPAVTEGMLKSVDITLDISGNGRQRTFRSHVVGYSGKINSILVPEDFLDWANREYGEGQSAAPSRLLVEFSDASKIETFIKETGYNIKQDELDNSKRVFFFKLAIAAVLVVALIIILLSVAFIVMSLNLIVQRNRDLFVNLYGIGYSPKTIARFYQLLVSIITAVDMGLAIVAAILLRNIYVGRLSQMFNIEGSVTPIILSAVAITVLLIVAYNVIVLRTIKKTVEPKKYIG